MGVTQFHQQYDRIPFMTLSVKFNTICDSSVTVTGTADLYDFAPVRCYHSAEVGPLLAGNRIIEDSLNKMHKVQW